MNSPSQWLNAAGWTVSGKKVITQRQLFAPRKKYEMTFKGKIYQHQNFKNGLFPSSTSIYLSHWMYI
jgi:hypothetical protein